MKRLLTALLLALPLRLMAENGGAWQTLQKGLGAYKHGDLGAAETNFEKAAAAAPAEQLDPAVAAYDRANAEVRAGRNADAAEDFEAATRTPDLKLQSMAYFNRGNVQMKIADGQQRQKKLEDAIKSVDGAMTMYDRSIMLAPADRDPKVNYELAAKKKAELEKLLKQQQKQNKQNQKNNKNDQNKKQQPQNKNQQNQDQQKKNEQNKSRQDQKKQEQQQPKEQNGQNEKNKGQENKPQEMTPQEAAAMLQSVKQEEDARRRQLFELLHKSKSGKVPPVDMDW